MTYVVETRAENDQTFTKKNSEYGEFKAQHSAEWSSQRLRDPRWTRIRRSHVNGMDDRSAKIVKNGKPNIFKPAGRPLKDWCDINIARE